MHTTVTKMMTILRGLIRLELKDNKLLERLIAQEHLYSEEQLKDMKKQLRVAKEEMNILNTKLKRGFGS